MSGFQTYKIEQEKEYITSPHTITINQKNSTADIKRQIQYNQTETITNDNQYRSIIEAKDREIANLRDSVSSLNNQINDYLKEIDQWRQKYKQLQMEKGASSSNNWEVQQLRDEIKLLKSNNQIYSQSNVTYKQSGGSDWELKQLQEENQRLKNQITYNSTNIRLQSPQNDIEIKNLKEEIQRLKINEQNLRDENMKFKQQSRGDQAMLLLQNENDQLKNQIEQLEIENRDLDMRVEQYLQELSQYQSRMVSIQSDTSADGYLKRISALQHEVIQWKDRFIGLERQYNEEYGRGRESIIQEKDAYIVQLEQKIKQLEDSNFRLKMDVERIRKEFDGYRISFEPQTEELAQYRSKYQEMESDIQILIQDIQQKDEKYIMMEQEYQQRISQLQNELQNNRVNKIDEYSYEYKNLKDQFERIQNDYRMSQDQINRYRNDYERLSNEYQVFQRDSETRFNSTQNNRTKELEDELYQLRERYNRLQMDFDRSQKEITIQKQETNQYVFIKKEYETLQQSYNNALYEIQQLKQQCSKYQMDYDSLNQNYLVIQRESETMKGNTREVEMLKNRIRELEYQQSQIERNVQDKLEQQFIERIKQYETTIIQRNSGEVDGLRRQISDLEYKLQQEKQSKLSLEQNFQLQINERIKQYETTIIQRNSGEADTLRRQISDLEYKLQQEKQSKLSMEQNFQLQINERIKQYETTIIQRNSGEADALRRQISDLEYKLQQEKQSKLQMEQNFQLQINERIKQYETTIIQRNSGETETLKRQISDLEYKLQQEKQSKMMLEQNLQSQFNEKLNQEKRVYETTVIKQNSVETDRLRAQVYDYEMKYSQLEFEYKKLQQELERVRSEKITYESTIVNKSNQEVEYLRRQIQDYESKLQRIQAQHDNEIQRYRSEISQLQNQMTIKIKESQTTIINEQTRRLQQMNSELESRIQSQQLEIDRLRNIKKEQESKISVLIEKVTDYESRINILQQENMRLEQKTKKSTYVEKYIPSSNVQVERTIREYQQPTSTLEKQLYFDTNVNPKLSNANLETNSNRYNQTTTITTINQQQRLGSQQGTQRLGSGEVNRQGMTTIYKTSEINSYVSPERLPLPPQVQQQNSGKYQSTKSVKQAIMTKQVQPS